MHGVTVSTMQRGLRLYYGAFDMTMHCASIPWTDALVSTLTRYQARVVVFFF